MENTQANGHLKQRVHWTQTPKGRRRIGEITKQRWKSGTYKKKVAQSKKQRARTKYSTAKVKHELAIELLLDQLNETAIRALLKRILLNR